MRCTISQVYFDKELYMFQTDLLSIIRSLNTVYKAIGICHASYVDCRSQWPRGLRRRSTAARLLR